MRNFPARQTYNKIRWHSFIGISFICLHFFQELICRNVRVGVSRNAKRSTTV